MRKRVWPSVMADGSYEEPSRSGSPRTERLDAIQNILTDRGKRLLHMSGGYPELGAPFRDKSKVELSYVM
jgi:hypothetical protein